jgi:hypothetical protein
LCVCEDGAFASSRFILSFIPHWCCCCCYYFPLSLPSFLFPFPSFVIAFIFCLKVLLRKKIVTLEETEQEQARRVEVERAQSVAELAATKDQLAATRTELENSTDKWKQSKRSQVQTQQEQMTQIAALQNEVAAAKKLAQSAADDLEELTERGRAREEGWNKMKERAEQLEGEQAKRDRAVLVLKRKTSALEEERRSTHAMLQTLRGNVRVVCRVRPLLGKENQIARDGGMPESGPFKFPARKPWEGNRDPLLLQQNMMNDDSSSSSSSSSKQNMKHFLFDRVLQMGMHCIYILLHLLYA